MQKQRFLSRIANKRPTNELKAFFAFAESLPTSVTLPLPPSQMKFLIDYIYSWSRSLIRKALPTIPPSFSTRATDTVVILNFFSGRRTGVGRSVGLRALYKHALACPCCRVPLAPNLVVEYVVIK